MNKSVSYYLCIIWLSVIINQTLLAGLDEYISKPDPAYRYNEFKEISQKGMSIYILNMTSQKWRNEKEVSRTDWQHWLIIYKPNELKHTDKALLWINGGDNRNRKIPEPDHMLANIANQCGAIVADLRMVPNQPLEFYNDRESRYEDNLVAYSLNKYYETGDAAWPVLFPMVKSAVRAMDTIQEYAKNKSKGKIGIKSFVVSGASKRGWTTWLSAAIDQRIIAIAPVVIDTLNISEQRKHHHAAYGYYSKATKDYQDYENLQDYENEQNHRLLKLIDPYAYINRLTMPKYIINSAQDQFFLPDSSQFYFDDLKGEKLLRYIANTDHSLRGSDADISLAAFYYSILNDLELPKIEWNYSGNILTASSEVMKPERVKLWQAANPETRDFRHNTIGSVWQSKEIQPDTNQEYNAELYVPQKGWQAYFLEMEYKITETISIKLTTEVTVLPNKLPYEK